MKLSKATLRLTLLGFALILCVLASGRQATAAACDDGDTRFVPAGDCCYTPNGALFKKKGQSCIFGAWTDNGAWECVGPCIVAQN
jgi:hypothetical protein